MLRRANVAAALRPRTAMVPLTLARHNSASAGGGFHRSSDRGVDPSAFVIRPPRNSMVHIVPQGTVMVVERLGRFSRILEPGLAFLLPFVDRIRYMYSSKEQGIVIPRQSAITRDNVMVDIDGVLFLRIVDPCKASYNIDNPVFNVINLAQTTMRCEIGKLTLDQLFAERDLLNRNIVAVIQTEAQEWGVECKRYEIRDVSVSDIVRQSMDLQAEAERRKRKLILESEGDMEATINRALGKRRAQEHNAEAARVATETNAKAAAAAMRVVADATAASLTTVAEGFDSHPRTQDAASLRVAEQYLEHFGSIAKEGTTVVLPNNASDGAGMATQALAMFNAVNKSRAEGTPVVAPRLDGKTDR